MTNWLPDIQQGHGPLYARIADQIELAIGNGALPVGAKLPPQRNLAYDIGVTIGTIGRAYNIVRERGLVSGEVGRGTYVLDHPESRPPEQSDPLTTSLAGTRPLVAPVGKLRFDSTAAITATTAACAPSVGTMFSGLGRNPPRASHWQPASNQ